MYSLMSMIVGRTMWMEEYFSPLSWLDISWIGLKRAKNLSIRAQSFLSSLSSSSHWHKSMTLFRVLWSSWLIFLTQAIMSMLLYRLVGTRFTTIMWTSLSSSILAFTLLEYFLTMVLILTRRSQCHGRPDFDCSIFIIGSCITSLCLQNDFQATHFLFFPPFLISFF